MYGIQGALLLFGWCYHGFVLRCLWYWFMMPLTDVGIDTVHAMGLLLLAYLLNGNYKAKLEKRDGKDEFISAVVVPSVILLLGIFARILMHPLNYVPGENIWP